MVPPLAHECLSPAGSLPERWAVFLHGILGTGGNWRSLGRRWLEKVPGWGVVLVDLREHGASLGRSPPHTLDACVDDLVELAAELPAPPRGVVGHSYGGKVALAWIARQTSLERACIVDANPGARPPEHGPGSVLAVVEMLRTLPRSFASRGDFVERVEAAGHARAFAQWLAMNLERRPLSEHAWVFKPDLDAIHALLDDYQARDLWWVLEHPPRDVVITALIGDCSTVLPPEDRARLEKIAARAPARVKVETIAGAGHWVHVDAPELTLGALARGFADV